jgi:hypothetical protein
LISEPLWVIDGLIFLTQRLLKILECQHHNCDVVKCLVGNGCFQYLLHNVSAYLVDRLIFLVKIFLSGNITLLNHLCIANFIENSIASKQQKIHFVVDRKLLDVRNCDNNIWISLKLFTFGLDVSKCSGNRKSSWKNTEWTINDVGIIILFSLLENCGIILTRLVCDCLNLLEGISTSDGLRLVDTATVLQNTFLFNVVIWLVI